ncbi:MAG: hypothetical protein J6A59_10245 [Lachnospiraceae bacterium]|nr:hypothetical protein [Lachnospiraceae bacterium]
MNSKKEIKNLSNKEKLDMLNMLYGGNVMCTNGLFHLLDDKHNEVYINSNTAELDRRGLYKTFVVMDKVVVSKVTNNDKVNFVILDKDTLECVYKTKGNIFYINDYMVCDKKDNVCTLISHTGKILGKIDNIKAVSNIKGSMYIASSTVMYNDRVLYYNKHKDELEDLTFDKNYLIHRLDKHGTEVEVISMEGGKYIYDFETHLVKNKFTGKVEKDTNLWKVI